MRSFDIFFDLRLNKRLSKPSRCWWFETLSYSLWCHCNGIFKCIFLSNQTRLLTMTHCIGCDHYNYVIISTIVSQITSLTIVYSSVWVNTDEAGDLRCHRAHYDVTVITSKLGATMSPKHQSQLQSKMIHRWWWHLNFRNTECTCQKLKLFYYESEANYWTWKQSVVFLG